MANRWYVYKCNSLMHDYQRAYGDWEALFETGKAMSWGSRLYLPVLGTLRKGDHIIAYQSNRNEIVGVADVAGFHRSNLMLEPLERIGVKVRPLKQANSAIERIPALRQGPIQTIYAIDERDARRLLTAARRAAGSRSGLRPERKYLEGERRAAKTVVRSAALRAAAKARWGLNCYCCGFAFGNFYGPAAAGIAIVHHLKGFTGRSRRRTSVNDVRVICPNCHLALHSKHPPVAIDRLRRGIQSDWTEWRDDGITRVSRHR